MSFVDLRTTGVQRSPITVGAVSGLIASIPTGIVLQFGTDILLVLGRIIGIESLVGGWIFHLVLSTVFGAFFGWHVRLPIFRALTKTVAGSVLWGVIFGAVWYAYVMIGIILPAIVRLFGGSGGGIPFSDIPGPAEGALVTAAAFAFAYIVYGGVLGGVYAVLEDVRAEPEPRGPDG